MFMNQKDQVLKPEEATAGPPQPATLSPEAAVEQLRVLVAQIPEAKALSVQERRALKRSVRLSDAVLQASISVIDASDVMVQAVGKPDEARGLVSDSNLWTTFENELRGALQRVADANVIRRQRAR